MKELCEDSTLKNLVIMIHQFGEVISHREQILQASLSDPDGLVQAVLVPLGAKIYRCTGASKPDLGALRIILAGRSVVPKVQQEPINKSSKSEQTAVRRVEPRKEKPEVGERHNSNVREPLGSTRKAVDKEVEGLRRQLEEQKRRAQQEADVFKKRIARMQSKEESIRKELEEEKRRARKEADGLMKCIAELQSQLKEDRHTSGKASATYKFRHVLPVRKHFLWDHSLT